MKPIKVDPKNAAAIEAVLKEANGRSVAHAFSTFTEVADAAEAAEEELIQIGFPNSRRPGAEAIVGSGVPVANSYKGTRNGTKLRLRRNTAGWVLEACWAYPLYNNTRGRVEVSVTEEQDVYLVALVRAQYTVRRPESS